MCVALVNGFLNLFQFFFVFSVGDKNVPNILGGISANYIKSLHIYTKNRISVES